MIPDGQRWVVLQGDCLAILPTLGSVDHIVTDPPYEAEAHADTRRVNGGRSVAQLDFAPIGDDVRSAVGAAISSLPNRWSLVFCQAEAGHLWRDVVASRFIRTQVWIKPDGSPQFTGDRPGTGFELLLAFHSDAPLRWNGGGRRGVYTHNCHRPDATGHMTEKPLSLMVELLELFTDPDDVILDPFCGSGTTLVAALRLGRRAIGIELNPEWAELARERCRAEESGSTLAARRAKQEPLFK